MDRKCFLCEKPIFLNDKNKQAKKLGEKTVSSTHAHNAKSQAHYAHLRPNGEGRKDLRQNLSAVDWKEMDIDDPQGSVEMCYHCHEIVLHNPVLSEPQLKDLNKLFKGKFELAEKVVLFNEIIRLGIKAKLEENLKK